MWTDHGSRRRTTRPTSEGRPKDDEDGEDVEMKHGEEGSDHPSSSSSSSSSSCSSYHSDADVAMGGFQGHRGRGGGGRRRDGAAAGAIRSIFSIDRVGGDDYDDDLRPPGAAYSGLEGDGGGYRDALLCSFPPAFFPPLSPRGFGVGAGLGVGVGAGALHPRSASERAVARDRGAYLRLLFAVFHVTMGGGEGGCGADDVEVGRFRRRRGRRHGVALEEVQSHWRYLFRPVAAAAVAQKDRKWFAVPAGIRSEEEEYGVDDYDFDRAPYTQIGADGGRPLSFLPSSGGGGGDARTRLVLRASECRRINMDDWIDYVSAHDDGNAGRRGRDAPGPRQRRLRHPMAQGGDWNDAARGGPNDDPVTSPTPRNSYDAMALLCRDVDRLILRRTHRGRRALRILTAATLGRAQPDVDDRRGVAASSSLFHRCGVPAAAADASSDEMDGAVTIGGGDGIRSRDGDPPNGPSGTDGDDEADYSAAAAGRGGPGGGTGPRDRQDAVGGDVRNSLSPRLRVASTPPDAHGHGVNALDLMDACEAWAIAEQSRLARTSSSGGGGFLGHGLGRIVAQEICAGTEEARPFDGTIDRSAAAVGGMRFVANEGWWGAGVTSWPRPADATNRTGGDDTCSEREGRDSSVRDAGSVDASSPFDVESVASFAEGSSGRKPLRRLKRGLPQPRPQCTGEGGVTRNHRCRCIDGTARRGRMREEEAHSSSSSSISSSCSNRSSDGPTLVARDDNAARGARRSGDEVADAWAEAVAYYDMSGGSQNSSDSS